jgi:hypothetical protein
MLNKIQISTICILFFINLSVKPPAMLVSPMTLKGIDKEVIKKLTKYLYHI